MGKIGSDAQLVPKFLRNRIRIGIRFAGELFAFFDSSKKFLGRLFCL